jgi:adenylate cyclase
MQRHSGGVELAQVLSTREAAESGHDFVEPGHLFIGVCSVGKMLSSDLQSASEISDALRATVQTEWHELSGIFRRAGADPTRLRRAIRDLLRASDVDTERDPGPSESTKRVLTRAGELAQKRGAPAAGLTDLLIALLDDGSEPIMAALHEQAVDIAALRAAASSPAKAEEPAGEIRDEIRQTLTAAGPDTARRFALLCELPLLFGRAAGLESLLQTVLERLIQVIPKAGRGALVVKDPGTGKLLLKAHLPVGGPAVSETLVQQAMEQRDAFIWPPGAGTTSLELLGIRSAMYAPLIWEGEPLGAVCVDNSETASAFGNDDLLLLRAVSHHAAMAVAHRKVQDELRAHLELASRLISGRFPPHVREKLLRDAAGGALPLGTLQSHITVLSSDIRGFTLLTQRLGAQRVSTLLNEYFPPLIEAIFEQGGAVERYVGDAIFAVFGSLEADDCQEEHALRAAMAMQEVVKATNARHQSREAPTCDIGIGIDCGSALHGFIGNHERIEFAVIGDPSNRAARYCTGAGPGVILISREMYERVFRIVEAQPVEIKTKEGNLPAYRVASVKKV